jgi:hypothetical protein
MPKYKLTASWPELDRDRYLRDFQSAINQAVIKAARKFLLAAVPRIPIFTGFARGALGNLEDVAGKVSGGKINTAKSGDYIAKPLRPRTYYYKHGDGTKVIRNQVTGRTFATQPKDIITEGRLTKVNINSSRVVFKFEVDIKYFDLLDDRWGAFAAGREAFDQELKVQLNRLIPKIGKYLIRREVKSG